MSDLVIFIIGLLTSFLCLGGFLIHGVVQGKVADVDEIGKDGAARPDLPSEGR